VMQFFTSAAKVTYFMCGNKKRLVPCHQPAQCFEKSLQTSKLLMFKEHRSTNKLHRLVFFNKFHRLTRNSQWMPWITVHRLTNGLLNMVQSCLLCFTLQNIGSLWHLQNFVDWFLLVSIYTVPLKSLETTCHFPITFNYNTGSYKN